MSSTPSSADQSRLGRLRRIPIEVLILAVLALLTRFVFISDPKAIVFDEVYFREFAMHYKEGSYYFDVHPPLAKLLLAAWGAIAGVDATVTNNDPATALRLLPALAGSALVLVVYALIRQLSQSRRVATFGAALVLLDNAVLVESRLILMDSMLLLFGLSAISVALAARQRTGRSAWLLWASAAALGGCAASTKLTGLTSLALVGLIWLAGVIRERPNWRPLVGQAAVLALVPFLVYVTAFAVHFSLLSTTGKARDGAIYDNYMTQEFQATLKGNPLYRPEAHRSFVQNFRELNSVMQRSQTSLGSGTHPYASKWTSWPIMKRGVYLYLAPAGNGKSKYIYTLGNPVVWWGTVLGALIVLLGFFARPAKMRPVRWPLAFLGVAWLINYLPFALIERPMFLYHYLYALIFSIAFVSIGLGALTGWIQDQPKAWSFPSRASAIGYWGLLATVLLAFLYFAPITYGIPLTEDGLDARMWLSSWR